MTGIKNKRKIQYEITDGMYNFWYRFVLDGRSSIEFHKGDVYYNAYVKKNLVLSYDAIIEWPYSLYDHSGW